MTLSVLHQKTGPLGALAGALPCAFLALHALFWVVCDQ